MNSVYQIGMLVAIFINLFITINNNFQIKIIHKATNSMKDQLVNEVRASSLAKGALEQRNLDNVRSVDTPSTNRLS